VSHGTQIPDVPRPREAISGSVSSASTKVEQSPSDFGGQYDDSKIDSSFQQNAISSQSSETGLVRYRITDDLVQDEESCEKIAVGESMICFAGKSCAFTQLPRSIPIACH
jgi:hypothetical protein